MIEDGHPAGPEPERRKQDLEKKTRTIVFMAVLVAIMLLFGFTPIGYIPLPFAQLTLMCLPVIIGTLVLRLRVGTGLGVVFILTSIAQLLIRPSALGLIMLDSNPFLCIVLLIIPRLLIAPVTWGVARLFHERRERLGRIVASAAGSLVNTFVYLGLMQAWFVAAIASDYGVTMGAATGMIWGIVLTNGLPEAALAAVLCPIISRALSKSIPPLAPARREERS